MSPEYRAVHAEMEAKGERVGAGSFEDPERGFVFVHSYRVAPGTMGDSAVQFMRPMKGHTS